MPTSAQPDARRFAPGPAGLDALAHLLEDSPGEATTPGAVFQAIALSCLHRFELSRDLLARTGDPEALHQVRVALRQLRSAFAIFRDVVADEQFEHLRGELRWLAATTNETRDLDALIARIGAAPAGLAQARDRACARTSKILASARSDRLLRDLGAWIANGVWLEVRNPRERSAAEFAAASLTRLRRRLAKQGRHVRKLDDASLHALRITAKKLRYAAWFFSRLFPGDRAARRADRFIEAMRALQDRLGDVQDVAVAPATLERLHIPEASWPRLPGRRKLVGRAADELERALACKPYWS
jgi:CHAD domain-containing protein